LLTAKLIQSNFSYSFWHYDLRGFWYAFFTGWVASDDSSTLGGVGALGFSMIAYGDPSGKSLLRLRVTTCPSGNSTSKVVGRSFISSASTRLRLFRSGPSMNTFTFIPVSLFWLVVKQPILVALMMHYYCLTYGLISILLVEQEPHAFSYLPTPEIREVAQLGGKSHPFGRTDTLVVDNLLCKPYPFGDAGLSHVN
jgi:hypothetical protein